MKLSYDNREFTVLLQPKFSTKKQRIVGVEALARWVDSEGNMISPSEFIIQFEENGFIVDLDRYMVEQACQILKEWNQKGYANIPIAVNFSQLNLKNPNFVEEISAIVKKHGVQQECIHIELSETVMVENKELLENLFVELRASGFKVSIDDFGSGLSSLGVLKDLKVDILKLDKSFFGSNKEVLRGDLVIEGLIKLAQSLNMYVIAEGVESLEQVEFLRSIGCDAVQGYCHAKPMLVEEFEKRYKEELRAKGNERTEGSPLTVMHRRGNKKVDIAINILDSLKVPAAIFSYNLNEHKCNKMALHMFEMDYENQWEMMFFEMSPEMQPDGTVSKVASKEYLNTAIREGYVKFNWIYETTIGKEIPCETTINKLYILDDYGEELFIAIFKDMRDQLAEFDDKQENTGFFFDRITDKTLFNIVTSLSNEWFFNYDIVQSTIQFFGEGNDKIEFPRGKHHFPDAKLMEQFVNREDLKFMYKLVEIVKKGVEKSVEIRLNHMDGEVCYYRFIYKIIKNDSGIPIYAVGKIFDIDEQKKLEELAQKDLLTNCYNKMSTEKIIEDILYEKRASSHALFVVDIDDFKAINDNLGHAFGDTVLKEIATNLHSQFREGDIVGRIGGDEFVVFLENMENLKALEEKAKAITTAFKNTYTGETRDYKVSGSVGIALYPQNGKTYTELFASADRALYQSKLQGKDRYSFYSEEFNDGTMRNLTLLENVGRIADSYFDADFVSNVFELLYEMKSKDTSFELVLEFIGKYLKVDRCFIFESLDKGENFSETGEWCTDAVTPLRTHFQNVPKEVVVEFIELIDKGGIFYCNDFSTLASEGAKTLITAADIQSILLLQTKDKELNYTRFCIGFGDCKEKRVWTEKEINSMKYILKMISIFMLVSTD